MPDAWLTPLLGRAVPTTRPRGISVGRPLSPAGGGAGVAPLAKPPSVVARAVPALREHFSMLKYTGPDGPTVTRKERT